MLKAIEGCRFIKWLHAGLYRDAALLESHSKENFLKESDIRRLMRRKYGMGGFVITEFAKPVGYTIYEQTGSVLEIINLVVHQDYRRRGFGRLLVEKLETRKKWDSIQLSVRESNLDAHLFFRDQGFLATGIKRHYFEDHFADNVKFEDAYHFRKDKTQ